MKTGVQSRSEELFEFANRYLVAGVSGAARLNAATGRPLYLTHGRGSRVYDVDGREFIDYNLSHGATFLGHDHPKIKAAVMKALDMGVIASYETEYHSRLAQMICETVPCAEQVRFANSGSEASHGALRAARVATGRQKLLKFEGHFHGLLDYVMWNAHGPVRDELPTYPYIPPLVESGGVPPQLADLVIVIPWNDPAALDQALTEHGKEIAACMCEAVNYNSGCVLPKPGFLETLRKQTSKHGIVLIFDEVLSSFRMAAGGCQEYYSVTPDMCTIAKAVANGVPMAIIAGKTELMRTLSPSGSAAHSGTYSGHLFSVMAAIASLEEICKEGFYDEIFAKADKLYGGLTNLFAKHGVPAHVQGLGARFGIYLGLTEQPWDYQEAARMDGELNRRFIRACYDHGVYFHNYGKIAIGHHGFSASHTMADIEETLAKVDDALQDMQRR